MDSPAASNKLLIFLFVMTFLIPATLQLGGLTMGFPRFYLLLIFTPAALILLFSDSIKLNSVDLFIALFSFFVVISLLVNHGLERFQFIGLTVVETCGAYLFARVFLRSPENQRFFWRCFALAMPLILPFAVIELMTDRPLLADLAGRFLNAFRDMTVGYPQRWGLNRVSGNFEHPILFGVFWAYGLATIAVVFRSLFAKLFFTGVCLMMVMMSLSSGAFLAVIFQVALLFWGLLTKDAWKLLLILLAIVFVVVEIVSDRPALVALSTRLAFSSGTAYVRVHIWTHGIQNVWANPVFGLGLNDWVRPHWLTSSVDNNWLLIAMRYGLPAFLCLSAAIGIMTTKLVRRKDLTELAYRLRRSYLITLTAVILALGTVAVWSGTQAFFFTFIGMGVALATSAPRTDTAHASIMEAVAAKRSPRFSRGPAEVPAGAVTVPSMAEAEAEPEPRYSRSRKIIIPRYRQRGPAE